MNRDDVLPVTSEQAVDAWTTYTTKSNDDHSPSGRRDMRQLRMP